jgi:hypothetical protein
LNISTFKVTILAEYHDGKVTHYEKPKEIVESEPESDVEMIQEEEVQPVKKGKTGPGSFKIKKATKKLKKLSK